MKWWERQMEIRKSKFEIRERKAHRPYATQSKQECLCQKYKNRAEGRPLEIGGTVSRPRCSELLCYLTQRCPFDFAQGRRAELAWASLAGLLRLKLRRVLSQLRCGQNHYALWPG